jgi:phosphoglycolate phosphatase
VSDSAAGILSALRQAFTDNGLSPLDPATERAILGPPFYESLPPIIGEDRLWPVIESYRGHYAEAMYRSVAFPGIATVLSALHREGRRLAIATSKPEHYAVPILDHLGLGRCFETIGGDDLDGSLRTKALVIGRVLDRLGRPDPSTIVMVGDRSHDVLGAREHGIGCIGVRWGYGLPGELEAAHADAICTTVDELAARLGVDVDARTS